LGNYRHQLGKYPQTVRNILIKNNYKPLNSITNV